MSDVKPISVDILDKEYHVSSPEEEIPQLKQAARELDSRMREIKANGKIIGTERIAVMAALNITYELLQSGGTGSADSPETAERIQKLQKDIDLVLASSAQMELT